MLQQTASDSFQGMVWDSEGGTNPGLFHSKRLLQLPRAPSNTLNDNTGCGIFSFDKFKKEVCDSKLDH